MSDSSPDQTKTLDKSGDRNGDVDRRTTNPYIRVLWEEFLNFINEPRVARFGFQFFMIATGGILFKILADRGFPLLDTIQFMFAWFFLMLLLPTPKPAKTDVDPFSEEI